MKRSWLILVGLMCVNFACKEYKYERSYFSARIPITLANPTSDTLYYLFSNWFCDIESNRNYADDSFACTEKRKHLQRQSMGSQEITPLYSNQLTLYSRNAGLLKDGFLPDEKRDYLPVFLVLQPFDTLNFKLNVEITKEKLVGLLKGLDPHSYTLRLAHTNDLTFLKQTGVKYYTINTPPPLPMRSIIIGDKLYSYGTNIALSQEDLTYEQESAIRQFTLGMRCQFVRGSIDLKW